MASPPRFKVGDKVKYRPDPHVPYYVVYLAKREADGLSLYLLVDGTHMVETYDEDDIEPYVQDWEQETI